MYKSSTQIKSHARENLLGKYSIIIPSIILSQIIIFVLTTFVSSFVTGNSLTSYVIGLVISYLIDIISGIFLIGYIIQNFKIMCNQPFFISDIFYGFKNHTNKIISLRFIILSIELIGSLPFLFFSYFVQQDPTYPLIAATVLSIIPAIGVSIWMELEFSMSYYLLVDFPDYELKELLRTSRSLMKENRGRLLYLMVSFLPLYLLGFLSFGIGNLWVSSYFRMSLTEFYMDLISRKNASKSE